MFTSMGARRVVATAVAAMAEVSVARRTSRRAVGGHQRTVVEDK